MHLILVIVVMIQTIGISCDGTSCDIFVTEGLFPGFIDASENSRCGSLRRIKPLIDFKIKDMAFPLDQYIKDCTSPIILQSNSTQPLFDARSKPIRSHKEREVIIECFAKHDGQCIKLFFHFLENYQDFTNETYFPDIFSSKLLDSSLLSVARCNDNDLSQKADGQIKSTASPQVEVVKNYINLGNSIITLNIRGNLVYAHSFDISLKLLIRKRVILKYNASVFIDPTVLSNLPLLEVVDFSNNGLQFLPETLFLRNSKLDTCCFSYNMLQTIPPYLFKQTIKLKKLKLDHNRLNSLPPQLLENNENLVYLYLDHNRLRQIPATFFLNNLRIASLRLNNNRLQSLNETLFPRNMRLLELYLDNNELREINLALFNDPEEKSREKLEKLELSPNPFLSPRWSYGKTEQKFVKTNMLIFLSISNNRLIELPLRTFNHSRFFDYLDASYNPRLRNLTIAYFMRSLGRITLTDCNIEYLQGEIDNVYYIDRSRIKIADFSRNKIRGIDRTFFWKCYNLQIIHLRGNVISHLEAEIFKDLYNLRHLDLSGNLISTLPSELFSLQGLVQLNVSRNRITTFGGDRVHLFPLLQSVTSHLQVLDLSHNCLTSSAIELSNGRKSGLFSLTYLNVEHNALTRIPKILFSQAGFRFSLGHNAIRDIEPSDLEISTSGNTVMSICPNPLDLSKLCSEVSNSSCSTLTPEYIHQISNNAFPHIEFRSCNHTLDISYNHVQRALREINFGCPLEAKCPVRYYQSLLCYEKTPCNVDLILKCPVVESCPFPCDCYKGGPVQKTIVNCSHRNLTVLPSVVPPDTQILHFENNRLQDMSNFSLPLWSGLIELYLDHNRINNAQLSHLPTTLRKLSLKHNRIQKLPKYPDEKSSHLKLLWLGGNPWLCDCSSVSLKTDIRTSDVIQDGKEILCRETNLPLLDTDDEYLCMEKSKFVLNIYLVVFLSILLPLFIGSASVLYYRNKKSIIAYTFVHCPRLFRCFWKVEEIDKGKQYDAFISYSGSDTCVVKDIIEELEQKEPKMSLCIHERDWLPGNDISSNIANSVCLSRKTVLILSREFLKSMWFSIELHSAYYQSLEDKVDRLILVLKGDLPPFSTLDNDLQVLLNTKTYLVWGERWFWEKLRYALSTDKIRRK